jgi:predicted phage terminase large subunit-like protein
MQRLHEDDLVGHVLEREGWEVLSFPAIAEQDEEHLIETLHGRKRFARRAGEALHPEREPLSVLDNIRRTIGEYNFASQYQQAPAPLEGGLVKTAWFKTYAEIELPERFDQVVQSCDTANKLSELADYSVCTTWGIKQKRIYLLHVVRKRLNYPDLKRAVREQAGTHRATVVLIEDKASGTQLVQELVHDGLRMVKAVKPEGDKVMRFNAQTATIENGFVYLPREAPWLADYLHEMATFPSSKYDDQADSTSQALAWINGRGSSSAAAWIDHARGELAYARHLEGLSVQAIAATVEATPDEVQRWLDQREPNRKTQGARTSPRALSQREPAMTELEVDSLLREYMSGRTIACSSEEYARRIRPALQNHATLCLAHGDKVRAKIVLNAVEELDLRFNVAE